MILNSKYILISNKNLKICKVKFFKMIFIVHYNYITGSVISMTESLKLMTH